MRSYPFLLVCRPAGLAAAVLIGHSGLLIWSAHCHSPTNAEVFLLPAGVSQLQLARYDLYRVNPPLIPAVAALPVVFSAPDVDWRQYDSDPLRRAEYVVGLAFFRANDSRAIWLTTLARCACIPFSVLGGWICYLWAYRLYGPCSGVFAAVLWATSPYILGHSALISPDAHGAAVGIAAAYAYWHWLKQPTHVATLIAGVLLGLAQLSKFTLLVFYPLWILLWIIWALWDDTHGQHGSFWKRMQTGSQLVCIVGTSVLIINFGYLFEGTGRTLGEFHFQSAWLTGADESHPSETGGNRFKDSWCGLIPMPLPANYIQGIDTQKADFERRPWSYLNGQWRHGGWWYFYFYALGIKTPLGTLGLVLVAALLTCVCKRYQGFALHEAVLLLPAAAILMLLTSQSAALSLHSKYAIPILPFVFIWTSKVARAFSYGDKLISILVTALLLWSTGSSMAQFPNSLTYFNELAGGPRNGYRYLAISDSSWGQDLLFLRRWLQKHPEASDIRIAVSGPVDPRWTGLRIVLPPPGPRSSRHGFEGNNAVSLGPVPGWYAIDTNLLIGGDPLAAADGKGQWETISWDVEGCDLSYFQHFQPIATAGYSIFIYRITPLEANRLRKVLGLNELPGDD
jgi:hypothetical protein